MRILQAAGSLYDWGGIERYVLYLAQGLRDLGHDVAVACPPGSPLAQRLEQIPHLEIATKTSWAWWDRARWARLTGGFDVVHTHFSPDFVQPALAAPHAKRVMTRHLAIPWKPAKAARLAGLYDGIVAVSDATRRALIDCGVPAGKVRTVYAGCPTPPMGSDPEGPFRVGFFGRFVEEKGLGTLIEAARRVPEAEFRLYGSGPFAFPALPPNVRVEGFVQDVAASMAACHAIAIPSEWAEAFPFSGLEAMACGRAVIASAVGGLPEQIVEGVNGRLVPPRDPESWAVAVRRLAQDPTGTRAMGARGRQLHLEKYTIADFSARISDFYASL